MPLDFGMSPLSGRREPFAIGSLWAQGFGSAIAIPIPIEFLRPGILPGILHSWNPSWNPSWNLSLLELFLESFFPSFLELSVESF